jgi:hypothetical protein
MQRITEYYGCIGDYLAHESVMGNLCSGKLSPILIGRGALNSRPLNRMLNLIVGTMQLTIVLRFAIQAATGRVTSSAS